MTLVTYIFIAVIAAELLLQVTVRKLRAGFQWLITEKDEMPELDREGLNKFFNSSYDPQLGWVRKPKTSGVGKGRGTPTSYSIDEAGARTNTEIRENPLIASFGDSYVFCRQVNDHETWQVALTRKIGRGVMNFGVGNYGADQGLIRYKNSKLPDSVEISILGFVPETICRIHSYWKHYLEFGNTFAFKPRFMLNGDSKLEQLENPMRSPEDFSQLDKIIPSVQKKDGFYRSKFRSLQFRFPYLLSFFRHPVRHTRMISALLHRAVRNSLGSAPSKVENRPFRLVMEYNIKDAHRMYGEPESNRLLTEIVREFKRESEKRGHKPLVLVMPQLLDLEIFDGRQQAFHNYFQKLSREIPVIDMTKTFESSDRSRLYVEDQYGGHLTPYGNELVAEEVNNWLKEHEWIPKNHSRKSTG